MDTCIVGRSNCIYYRYCSFLECLRSLVVFCNTEVGVLVDCHHVVCCIHDGEAGVCGNEAVFCNVETCDLFFFGSTETNDRLDCEECDCDCNCCPCCCCEHTDHLDSEELEAAAVEETCHAVLNGIAGNC